MLPFGRETEMSETGRAFWSGWYWVGGVVILCLLSGAALFFTYAHYFPTIMGFREDWNVFGALLGGFGSCIGALATLSTLLFLAHQNRALGEQNRKQLDFIEWQITSQTFEQYVSHRSLFLERLSEIRADLDDKYAFYNGADLYSALFPENDPTTVKFQTEVSPFSEAQNLLAKLGGDFERLDGFLRESQWDHEKTSKLVKTLWSIHGLLHAKWEGDDADGDVYFFNRNTGLNIYTPYDFVESMVLIYNALLRYSGNPKTYLCSIGVTRYVREALIRYFNETIASDPLYALKTAPKLAVLEDMLFQVGSLVREDGSWLLPETYRQLSEFFFSRENVVRLQDAALVDEFVTASYAEMLFVESTLPPEGDHSYRLRSLASKLTDITIAHMHIR